MSPAEGLSGAERNRVGAVPFFVALLGLFATTASAAPDYTWPDRAIAPVSAPPARVPVAILRTGIQRLGQFLSRPGGRDPVRVHAFLEREIAGDFDFRAMSRWVAGPYYRRITGPQRERLSAKLHGLFFHAIARNLGTYARPLPRIDIYPTRAGRSRAVRTVRVRVIPTSGFAIRLDFRFYRSKAGWKVFDVAADGASAIAYYRRYFARRIAAIGPTALYE